jgi:hypothetical protein
LGASKANQIEKRKEIPRKKSLTANPGQRRLSKQNQNPDAMGKNSHNRFFRLRGEKTPL